MQFSILNLLIKILPQINENCHRLEMCVASGSDLQMCLDDLRISS